MDYRDIPIYIINHDNLNRGFRRQVEWLLDAGSTNINVIDNASTYPPLLEYYKSKGFSFNLIRQTKNLGPWIFWETGMAETVSTPYIVSDADCVPDKTCPKDLIKRLLEVQEKYSKKILKIGPGLRIDNLPDHYSKKQKVIDHETQFSLDRHRIDWFDESDPKAFDAIIDTTFALYQAGELSASTDWCKHFRLDAPYLLEHIPWYENSQSPSEEYQYYRSHIENNWSCWEIR